MPAYGRHHTSQILKIQKYYFLIDCGEGTQLRLSKYKIKYNKIHHILISHLHGDHYLGLVGLISSMHLMGRVKDLHVFGPKGLKEIITTQFKYSETILNFVVHFHETNPRSTEIIHENDFLKVTSFPLDHRIPCTGFLFQEKPKLRKIDKTKLPKDMPLRYMALLKKGQDIFDDAGEILYQSEALTLPASPSYSYAYCSDTRYNESILPTIKKADLLYHETTFLKDKGDRAATTFHSTTQDAAVIATKAEVGKLLIGHFSARYRDLEPFLEECQEYFKNTELALEGATIELYKS